MRKLIAKDLKIKFIETLNELDEFSYEEGNPFLIKIGTAKYFVFLKNLSPAYFKASPDVTRVQLPFSERFSKIFKADIPFIILGYDVDTDTVVSWNPKKVKERLNAKSNVSLYSRSSLQEEVKDNEFRFGYLSNGEKIVLFKRENLIHFFDVALSLFKEDSVTDSVPVSKRKEPLSSKERFIIWLQENNYSDGTVKHYTSGLNKVSKDLKDISELKHNSIFDIVNVSTLQELFKKWFSVKEFKDNDTRGQRLYSNSIKRYIEFCKHEQTLNPKSSNKTKGTQTETELQTVNIISEITDKELLQTIKPLLKKNQVLQTVEITSKHYGNKHKNMTFKDWYKIVSELYRKMNS
ncbi:MAG: hypothetical protein HS119_00100 [Flavobacteriales bacterium]|nr:hypothetical protein [Flavobacteriales bacterium]